MHRIPFPVILLAATLGAGWAQEVRAEASQAPQRTHQVLRWKEDWRWIEGSPDRGASPFDAAKAVNLGGDWRFDFGGSFRFRGEADGNRTLGAEPTSDERLLGRTFLHFSFYKAETFRFFVETRYSDVLGSDRPKGALFADDPDLQNAFLEFTIGSKGKTPVTVRAGRQELLFGVERIVSPLDWSDTRRTFDGLTVTARSPRTETTVFGTWPVAHEPHSIDSRVSEDLLFWGVHSAIEPAKGHRIEAFAYVQDDSRDVYRSERGPMGDLERQTYGGRYLFERDGWKVDFEGALQRGCVSEDDIEAAMANFTFGRAWAGAAWKPGLDFGLDVASGDSDPDDGRHETFNQIFPLGHAYLGHVDLVGRQNVQAARLGLALSPRKNVKWVTTLHAFRLDERRDALYDAGGAALRRDRSGASGRSVATELDALVSWRFKTHHYFSAEVAKWWSDEFIEDTATTPRGDDDAWFAWLAYELKF